MSERISHDDMLQRVAAAREGWQVSGAYLVQAHDDAMDLNRIADELVAERDQLRQRSEAAEAQLAIVSGLNEWHDLPELPSHVGHYLAFWKEDGVWVAQYWPSGIEDENGNKGNWLTTPDGSIRPNPITWRHLPSVPDRYVVQAEYSARKRHTPRDGGSPAITAHRPIDKESNDERQN